MRRIVVGLLAAALACVTLVPVAASATTIAAKCDFRATVTFSPGLTPTAQPVDYTISGNLWSSRRDCPATSASPAVLQGIVHSDAAYCNGTAVLGEPAVGLPHMEWQGGAHSRVRLVLKSVEPRLLRLKGLVKSGPRR
jgi:hypothetical protein